MSVKTDKWGFKHYRMKMDTGYINAKGGDLNARKNEMIKSGHIPQFNFIQTLHYPMKRIKILVPGFTEFGLKKIILTEMKSGEIIFAGAGFTLFKMTRCRVSKKAIEKMVVGEKYKITIQKWTV